MGDEGAASLSDALIRNSSVAVLKLQGNQIRSDGAKSLADAIGVSKTLRELLLTVCHQIHYQCIAFDR
jgi:Ran GTPase-activating protein (RanGAP) involved in mRNA processing and transport